MRTQRVDGGPAFPSGDGKFGGGPNHDYGMSLRDAFAIAALQTMNLNNSWCDNPHYWEGVARSAYVCADAMLAARATHKGEG